MDRSRPRTSRPRRRPEPLIAKPRPQDSESDTLTETDTESIKAVRPTTACFKPAPRRRSKISSGVRGDEKYLSAYDSTDTETDSDTIKAISRKSSCVNVGPPRSSSGVQGDETYYSAYDSTGTETDTETLKPYSPKASFPTPELAEGSIDVRSLQDNADYSSDFDSDDADTVISIAPKQKYSEPAAPMNYSDVRSVEGDADYAPISDSDDTQTVVSVPPKDESLYLPRPSSAVRSEKCLKDETPRVPFLNLDDLDSVSGNSSVTLKSIEGFTDLKVRDFKRRNSSGSRIGEQLKKIDSKNRLFFPSKNLTRPSIENIYGPVKKRSPSLLRQSSNPLVSSKTTSSLTNDRTKDPKATLVEDTPRPSVEKVTADKPSTGAIKKVLPKILPPLMTKNIHEKKIEKIRATPVKPKPFTASGCGKGIPSLEKLPKPKIGRVPSFILNKKKNGEDDGSLKSGSLNVLDKTEIKPAISKSALSDRKTTDDLFTRNRIPLRKHGSQSTSNLLASSSVKKEKPKQKEQKEATPPVKAKKSVTFLLPEEEIPEPEKPVKKCAYVDEHRRQYLHLFEKPPTFDEGPLPVTQPSSIYQNIQSLGWDYSRFTPKKPNYPVPTIPYNFLDQYLHIFDNNLERAAVHTKLGLVSACSCEENNDGSEYCEKHVDINKLQYYNEAAQVMISILSLRYEVPEYNEVEEMFQENYPFIYRGWVQKKPRRLSMDYRVREAKCKSELVKVCEKILTEEDLLAEFQQSEELIGHKRDITLSGLMKDVEEDFEYSYGFLFTEYPHLFIQLAQKIEFIPLAIERRVIASYREAVVNKANLPDEELEAEEEFYRTQLEE